MDNSSQRPTPRDTPLPAMPPSSRFPQPLRQHPVSEPNVQMPKHEWEWWRHILRSNPNSCIAGRWDLQWVHTREDLRGSEGPWLGQKATSAASLQMPLVLQEQRVFSNPQRGFPQRVYTTPQASRNFGLIIF